MGLLDTLFGGQAEQDAANANQALAAQYGTTGTNLLNTGLDQSTGAVNTGAANAATALGQNTGIYGNLGQTGANTLNTGLTNQLGALGQAGQAYAPLSSFASQLAPSTQMYMNSLGLNGAQGNAAATSAFQTAPGYDFQMQQGLDAINRARANAGMLNSGNTSIDAMTYGQGLANQAYSGWQSQLQGLINPQLSALGTAAAGQAGADTNMATAYGTNAAANTALQGTVAAGQAGTNTALAQNQANLGNSLAGLYSGNAANQVALQGGVTSADMSANNTAAAGQAAGAKNLLSAGLGVAGLVAGGPIGGAIGGGLGSLFGGSNGGTAASPLPGLTAADYGTGLVGSAMAQYGLAVDGNHPAISSHPAIECPAVQRGSAQRL